MAKRAILAFSVILFVFFVSSFVANAFPGGRTKIPDVKTNKEIQDLGRYSVEEYNRLRRRNGGAGGGDLKFSHVIEAEKQVVSGIKYYLKIQAYSSSSGVPKIFDAEVVVKAWVHKKQLVNFSPSPATK